MPTTIHCQFDSPDAEKLISVFGAPQDPSVYSNLSTVQSDDPRYVAYYEAQWEWVKRCFIKPGD